MRVGGDPLAHVSTLRAAVAGIDPEMPVSGLSSMARLIENRTAPYKVYGVFYVVFGGTALFLAIVALYGVMAFSVSARSAELGIRMALGAGARGIRTLVLRSGLTRIVTGIALGTGLAVWISRGLTRVLFQVQPWDGAVYLSIILVLGVTALAACIVPAFRAACVNPTDVMRNG